MSHTAFERAWEGPVTRMKNPWWLLAGIAALVIYQNRYRAQVQAVGPAGVQTDMTGAIPVLNSTEGPSVISDPNSAGGPLDWSTPATHPSFGPVYSIADPQMGGFIGIADCSKGPC